MSSNTVRTASGRTLDEINIEALRAGELTADDFCISSETLRRQADAAEAAGYWQLAENLRRAAELTGISNQEVVDIYNALRPNRSTYNELITLADRLEGITYHNHARTGEVYQMEGPAWETDLVGFRNYLDQRNGMDIFGKLTGEMVLDSVGVAGRQSYHDPDDWGMDVLKVGTSLGAGSIGYMYSDSIYRVGDSGSGTYELLMEGSQRSRFLLSETVKLWPSGP